MPTCPSVRKEQFSSQMTDFPEILYWVILLKYVEKIPALVKSKVKFTLEQAMKAQRGRKGIALPFL